LLTLEAETNLLVNEKKLFVATNSPTLFYLPKPSFASI